MVCQRPREISMVLHKKTEISANLKPCDCELTCVIHWEMYMQLVALILGKVNYKQKYFEVSPLSVTC